MFHELGLSQLNSEGRLVPWNEICVVAAERIFRERWELDTEQIIAQMIFKGKPIDHWYYRSKEWVEQPYFIPSKVIQPYRGPVEYAHVWLYGEGTYLVNEKVTNLLRRELSGEDL